MAGPLYDAVYGIRKGMVKNPQVKEAMPGAIGALGVGVGLVRVTSGTIKPGTLGDDVAIFARGLNGSGIVKAVFRDRAPHIAKTLEGVATTADLVQVLHDVRPGVVVGHIRDAGKAVGIYRDPAATPKKKFEATRKAVLGLANDVSNFDSLFGSVAAVATTMPNNILGRTAGKLVGNAIYQKTGAAVKRILPAANWIIFADSTVNLVKVFSDPKATLGQKLAADASWFINGIAVAGGLPKKIVQGMYAAYTTVKLTQSVVDLATEAQKRHAAPPPLQVDGFFRGTKSAAPTAGRYERTIAESFAGG